MTIGSVPYQAFPSMGFAISQSQGGRMSLPVSPSSYMHAHFRHVSGVPAPEGVEGVSINTLRVLDILLEQLDQLTQLARTEAQAEPFVAQLDLDAEMDVNAESYLDGEARVNLLIEQYAQLRADMEAEGYSNPFAPTGPFAGMLFGVNA